MKLIILHAILLTMLTSCITLPHINAQAEYINYTRGPIGANITIRDGTIRIAPGENLDGPTDFYLELDDEYADDNIE